LKKEIQTQPTHREDDGVFLVALSASSGIAFFEKGRKIFELNSSSGVVEELERDIALRSLLMEYGLEPVEKEFETQADLEAHVKTAYWRKKKGTYYTLLLTDKTLDASLRDEMIGFLNQTDFDDVPFSPQTVEVLESQVREKPQLLTQLVQEVVAAQAFHVHQCLVSELSELLDFLAQHLINRAMIGQTEALEILTLAPLFERLVDKACQVDDKERKAFGVLYRMYHQELYQYICQRSRNPHIAEEVVQEAFIKAMQRLGTFKGKTPKTFKSWLFQIATRTWIDSIRSSKDIPTEDTDLPVLIDDVRQIHEDALERLVKEEQKMMLHDAIRALPEKERTVIYLHHFEEMTFKEIATILGNSLRSMDNYKNDGLNRLQNRLQNSQ
jgi:RNA polymerase sigma-70 factor, ECF subfamily